MKKTKRKDKITSILPIKDYNDEYTGFVCDNKSFMDVFKIASKDLNTLDEVQIQVDVLAFLKLYRTYGDDIKIIGLNFPVDTSRQRQNIKRIRKRTDNYIYNTVLDEEMQELEDVQTNLVEQEYYLFYFGNNEEDLNDKRTKIRVVLERNGLYLPLTKKKKLQIFKKINNPNSRIDLRADIHKEAVSPERIKELGYNPLIVEEIQPRGNIDFTSDDRVIKTGDGYMTCIYVHELEENLRMFWLAKLVNIHNAISVVDINTETNMAEVKKNLNKAVNEQAGRVEISKDATDIMDARNRLQELADIYDEMKKLGEIIKNIRIRIFVSADSYVKLEERVSEIINELDADGYKCAINLNEAEYEWKSIFLPFQKQNNLPNSRIGIPVFSETLAGGHPFHFSSLLDPGGVYYGRTDSSGGAVLWDMFTSDGRTRNYYNAVIAGLMKSGKSTLLKKIFKDRASKGDFLRGFDVSGEWQSLVKAFGGKMISLDGEDGILNPWQVLKTAETEQSSFKQHISKLCTIYKFLKPTCSDSELYIFEEYATRLYVEMGLIKGNASENEMNITGLSANQYPISSDFVKMLDKILNADYSELPSVQQEIKIEELKTINNIKHLFDNLITTYGKMFNGYSTVDDILNEQIVFFDIRHLINMKDSIFDAQVFSALSLCYDNCIKIGSTMKRAWEQKTIEWQDITRFLIICDEAHRFVNADKIMAVQQLVEFQREARKFFGGIIFASQSIKDFVRNSADKEAIKQINNLFEFCQYKILMRQDANAVDSIKEIFAGELTEQEAEDIPSFETGQCILCMGNKQNIRFHIYLSESDERLFEGGA